MLAAFVETGSVTIAAQLAGCARRSHYDWLKTDPRYRQANANLRTRLERIIRRAGVEAWPKLFQNLRSSRQSELAQTHAEWKVCRWMGNSQAVGRRHYLQLTDADYADAAEAVQNPVQTGAELTGTDGKPESAEFGGDSQNPVDFRSVLIGSNSLPSFEFGTSTPKGSRTPVAGLRTRSPRPLDDGGLYQSAAVIRSGVVREPCQ